MKRTFAGTIASGALRRQRGISLIQLLCVTSVFALMSAILFPRFATPSNVATVGIFESASTIGMRQAIRHTRMDTLSMLARDASFVKPIRRPERAILSGPRLRA